MKGSLKCLINWSWKHSSNSLCEFMAVKCYFRTQEWRIPRKGRNMASHHPRWLSFVSSISLYIDVCWAVESLWRVWQDLELQSSLCCFCWALHSEEFCSGGLVLSKKWSSCIKRRVCFDFEFSFILCAQGVGIFVCVLKWNNKKSKHITNVGLLLDCLRYWKLQTSFAFFLWKVLFRLSMFGWLVAL